MKRRGLRPAHRHLRWVAILSALLFAGCAYSLINGGRVNEPHASKVEQGIQEIRELTFKSHVPIALKDPDQVEQMVLADLKRDYSDEQLEADGKAGSMLGLFPPGTDLKAETVKLLKSQIAGFYEPHEKEMVLVEGVQTTPLSDRIVEFMVQRDLVNDMLLAHELTHALQDQNFELQKKLDQLKDNGDAELALKSVAEGDATIAGFAYVVGRMDNSVAQTLTVHLRDLPQTFAAQSKDTPAGLSIPLVFQYSEGVRFVSEAYQRGGWKGVDALYLKPPQSTQQIIDPSLYFDNLQTPTAVSVSGYQSALAQWNKVDEDTFGELSIQLILQIGYGEHAPQVALAKQWAGDRLAILQRGSEVAVIWLIVFHDDDSAHRFEDAYRAMLDRERASVPHQLARRGSAVLVLAGPVTDQAATLASAIWKGSTIGTSTPTQPSPAK